MRFLVVIPHYGTNKHLETLLPSLGVKLASNEVDTMLEGVHCIQPLSRKGKTFNPISETWDDGVVQCGEIFIWNNNLRNLGFTKACNEGIRYGLNQQFDVIWLLNNDTEVYDIEKAISSLETEFKDNPKTGIVGFKILQWEDEDFIHHGGTGACIPAGVHKVGRVSLGQLEERTKERWVTGASMAISSGCLMETGVMDDKMVLYCSDSDLCYRARYAGFDVVYLPIPIKHRIGSSAHPNSPEEMKIGKNDTLTFHSKWLMGRDFYDLDNELLV
jgi:GT2 family glycosyltransferase